MPMNHKQTAGANADRLQEHLDVFDLAARWKRHAVTVRVDHAAGRIPRALRIGRSLRWRMADIEAFENGSWRPCGAANKTTSGAAQK